MPNPPSKMKGGSSLLPLLSKKNEIVLFSSTAIALYGYDQGMMSLINTNNSYLHTMQISEESSIVGIIVSIYYLGCTLGAVVASRFADKRGRKPSIFLCLATTSAGNILMFISGLSMSGSSPWSGAAIWVLAAGRVIMGLGVGGIDAVIPVYSSELSSDGARGKALAQEFQMNIFGLLMAYGINLGVTIAFGNRINGHGDSPLFRDLEELEKVQEEESDKQVGYKDMLLPGGSQFHPSMVTVMGQVNQALTGYGAVSVYGPQIFKLLGFQTRKAEYLTLGNYISYFFMMTFAWLTVDVLGRRKLMVWGAISLAQDYPSIPDLAVEIPGSVTLFIATAIFGIGWLSTVWLIPTEIYPSTSRAQGSAISVIIWGIANFAITLLTPIGFNNLKFWLFAVFSVTNAFAGWWTWRYSLESGGRSFEENQEFFESAEKEGSWVVSRVDDGRFEGMPGKQSGDDEDEESAFGK
ncbi:major facilitator superfamily domain-containing protein [Halenospora varia]|nr:major facilitator superfamily domain-containing protein [Halenospora varia]